MTTNTTTNAAPATLTQQELFREFAEGELLIRTRSGKEESRHRVADMMAGFGETEDFLDAVQGIFEDLKNDPDPTFGLSIQIATLRGILEDMNMVHDDFQRFKAQRLIETGRNELEQNKRYRPAA